METTQVELPWEQQEHDELEESLIARKKNLNQAPTSTPMNDDFSSNNGDSFGVTNGEDEEDEEEDKEEEEEEEEEVKHLSQQDGVKVDEDDKDKEKQQKSEYIVYYDADKGIWKCRICTWDNQGRTCPPGRNQRICFFHKTKGAPLNRESSDVEANVDNSILHGTIPMKDNDITNPNQENGNGSHFISNQNGEHEKQINSSDGSLQPPSEISFEEVEKPEINDIELIKDVENEYDVETVLKKQETHDLFCPNCNSCITKRVILRKRKRRIPVPGEIAKRNKPEISNTSEVNVVSDETQPLLSNDYEHEREPDVFRCLSCFSIFMPTGNGFKLFRMFGNKSNVENNQNSQKEASVKKNWFLNMFASDKVEQSNNQGSSRQEANSRTTDANVNLENNQFQSTTPSVNQQQHQQQNPNSIGYGVNGRSDVDSLNASVNGVENAPSSTPRSNTIKQPNARESDTVARESNGSSRPEANSHTTNGKMGFGKDETQFVTPNVNQQQQQYLNAVRYGVKGRLDADSLTESVNGDENAQGSYTIKQPIAQGSDNDVRESNGLSRPKANSSHTTNVDMDLEKGQIQSDTPSVNGDDNAPSIVQRFSTIKQPVADESDNDARESIGRITTDSQSADTPDHLLTSYHTEFNSQSDYPGMFVVRPPIENIEPEQDLISPYHDGLKLQVPPNIGSLIIDNSQMNQVLDVTIQTNPDLEIGSRAMEQGGGVTATGGRSLDIVKSIVYGGLLEVIASLSVVASAVGANAATLNVLALGLANIFGGLFVISHDLWDLKNECARSPDEDRYQQLLGRRADFPLHMLVSLLSYLVFGFLPPVVYGFSFRESNDRDFKLLMVAAASIVCIMVLAAGKAYVQNPRKSYIKTIAYYVVFGFVVSGVSYLFGELIMKLLEKIDIFPSGEVVNVSALGAPALIAAY